MARQWFVEGVQVFEDGAEELFLEGVQVNEDQASVAAFNPANGFPWPTHTFYSHRIAGVLYQQPVSPLVVQAAPETITLDKWEPRLPSLLFQKKWSRPTENYTFFTSLADLRVPTDWIQPITVPPARPTTRQQPSLETLITVEVSPAPILLDWLQPLSTPVRSQPAALPPTSFSGTLPVEITTLDWLQPLSQPQKPPAGLLEAPGAYPPIFPNLPEGEVTLDKWYTPIQQPIFRPAPLRQSQITVCLPESTFATVTIITRVALQFTAPRNLLDFTTTTNDLDYTAPKDRLDYTADDF